MRLARGPLVQGLLAMLVAASLMAGLIAATVALSLPLVVGRSCSTVLMFPLFLLLLPVILATGWVGKIRIAARLPDDARRFSRLLAMVGCLLSGLLLGVFGSFVGPQYLSVFATFGADLPTLTLTALMPGHFFWGVPLLVFVGLALNADRRLRTRWFGWAWAVETCLLVLVVGAMYLPIFKLGCVVS